MGKIATPPLNDSTNGWNRILPPRRPHPSLQADILVDWVVVGAGQAGLAAARRLAENRPGDRIALVEAGEAGDGAQGRNAGFIIDTPHNIGSSLEALATARDYITLARAAIQSLEEQVRKHNIQCDWEAIGKLHTAVTPRGISQILAPTRKTLEALNEPYTWFEGDSLHQRIGFKHFSAGIHTPGAILVNPAALSRGLADNLPPNVTVYENTPVTTATLSPEIRLATPHGSIRAGKAILAVSVFAEQFGILRNRLIPISACASLSRQLSKEEQEKLAGLPSWGLTPANSFVGVTVRRTRDQRILIRQNMRYQPQLRREESSYNAVRLHHQDLFDRWFPALKGVTIEHTWSGFICISRNSGAGFGEVTPNVYSSVCDNGLGWTKGTISGLLIADKATGIDNPLITTYEALGRAAGLPPRPFRDIGIRARFSWELWRNRHEA
ncbi:NAD(P)/FAD-dependent oxidoreductase [Azonexus fungiphilus]|uniref:NAD(P)/FAD-dependent oxidoreductase n=1 Tax=Azonexus fungiphilus TaxID=146940 RepID=UPI00156AAFC2|nr:FAD-binding oxidoreductase [Azonexus fungiphilus]NHC05240.1 FAD-binding oxidoreductase [Azonexus fungiphilus]